jgi:transcription-repair coupling factor (superfamily II helicase)
MVLPFVRDLFSELERGAAFRTVQGGVWALLRVTGLTQTARLIYAALFARQARRPVFFFTRDNKTAEAAADILEALVPLVSSPGEGGDVVLLPAHDTLPYEGLSPHAEIAEKRAIALWKLARGRARLLVAPLASAAMRLEAPEFYAGLARVIHRGEALPLDDFLGHLAAVGYTRHEPVEMVGQFSVRGGIVDVFSPEAARPIRMELFGDDVESIREFDPDSQRSLGPREEALVLPLTDIPLRPQVLAEIGSRLHGELQERYFTPGEAFPGWEFLVPLVSPLNDTLFDLAADPLVLIEEPEAAQAELEHLHERLQAEYEQAGRYAHVFPGQLYLSRQELEQKLAGTRQVYLEELGLEGETADGIAGRAATEGSAVGSWQPAVGRRQQCAEAKGVADKSSPVASILTDSSADSHSPPATRHSPLSVSVASQPVLRFHGNVRQCAEEVQRLTASGHRLVFFAATTGDVERLADIFGEYGIPFQLGIRQAPSGADGYLEEKAYIATPVTSTVIVKGAVPHGVLFVEDRLAVFGAEDLFDTSELVAARPQPKRAASRLSTFLSDFADLRVGDYIVHIEHGVGRYLGLKEIAAARNGNKGEFMLLEYAEEARLYVPLERLDLVQKYRSIEGAQPHLDRLGGTTWEKTKARVRKSMREMAEELLKLYAQRRLARRDPFGGDTHWQREFEDTFEFQETPDQATAVADIKADMEKPEPMDRLLCGDVGYGKTEVAMRAAFKAVQDSRQVAVLAPTTVLVFQHYETFRQRFAAFPIRVEMLSRFRSPAEQKQALKDIELGKVDIVIGTHRLLSKDVVFRDLGLLVVDEEQRFGVRHKERIKQLRQNVDVLAMSATPIPRTLHMSLVGLRDMSVIETAPRDRLTIQTVVAPFSETIVRTAIEQELARGGQVYFVHNRVESIYTVAATVQKLVPRARVAVAHGQMPERHLEKVMLEFVQHRLDVLLATTIVENGLDIPLCNTIIVNRADRHGLSELYQLRGRVGRSNRRAYAYLLIPEEREMSELARQRLSALKEFSDLGSGFKIAALDLELRGAGNLLGGQQHGHINAVGFDLYTQLLERAVRELKGEEVESEIRSAINLGLDIRIPANYIPEENQRLRMYKRLAGVRSSEERLALERELADRYGPPPAPVCNLLTYADLKLAAGHLRIQSIERRQESLNVKFQENASVDPRRLMDFVASRPGARFTPAGVLRFPVRGAGSALSEVRQLLQQLA